MGLSGVKFLMDIEICHLSTGSAGELFKSKISSIYTILLFKGNIYFNIFGGL